MMQQMHCIELLEYLDHNKPTLLDVREAWEFEICHIEGSVNVSVGMVSYHLNDLKKLDEIVVICHHGVRSVKIIEYLEKQNLTANLINLEGGVDAWAKDVDSSMETY